MTSFFANAVGTRIVLRSAGLSMLWFGLLLMGVAGLPGAGEPGNDGLVVEVAEGVFQVRLEVQDPATGAWRIEAIAYLDGKGGTVKFRIPEETPAHRIRVMTSQQPPAHDALRYTAHDFEARPSGDLVYLDDSEEWRLAPGVPDGATDAAESHAEAGIVQSDIWKLDGHRLYFFNHYRGLQVIDLQDPEEPRQVGWLPMEAVGEELYLLNADHVVLLVGGGWDADAEVVVARVSEEVPVVVGRVAVRGRIRESRMLGSRLFLVTQSHDAVTERGYTRFVERFQIHAVALEDPEDPRVITTREQEGSVMSVGADQNHLLIAHRSPIVAGSYPSQNRVSVYQLNHGSETPFTWRASVGVSGTVADKFKMQVLDGVLTVISHEWNWWSQR